jgi:3-mercaptopyruvate sulfurtransferase SseA
MLHDEFTAGAGTRADADSDDERLSAAPAVCVGVTPASAARVGAGGLIGLLAAGGLVGLLFLVLLVALVVGFAGSPPPAASTPQAAAAASALPPVAVPESLFVDVGELRRWQQDESEDVLLLDAREPPQWGLALHIRNTSCALPWKSLSQWEAGGADRSVLRSTAVLQRRLRECGLRRDRGQRVVAYGDWATAWGEEGRLLWTLEYLSPTTEGRVYVLRGGFAGWQAEYPEEVSSALAARVATGDFVATEQPQRRLLKPQITSALRNSTARAGGSGGAAAAAAAAAAGVGGPPGRRLLLLLDSREPDEYTGATDPYGVARAGHVPGAISFPWRSVFEPSRMDQAWPDLLPCDALRPRFLQALSLSNGEGGAGGGAAAGAAAVEVGTYCTGGIRSGFLYLVLRECFPPTTIASSSYRNRKQEAAAGATTWPVWQVLPKNYDGSMWQWADDAKVRKTTTFWQQYASIAKRDRFCQDRLGTEMCGYWLKRRFLPGPDGPRVHSYWRQRWRYAAAARCRPVTAHVCSRDVRVGMRLYSLNRTSSGACEARSTVADGSAARARAATTRHRRLHTRGTGGRIPAARGRVRARARWVSVPAAGMAHSQNMQL